MLSRALATPAFDSRDNGSRPMKFDWLSANSSGVTPFSTKISISRKIRVLHEGRLIFEGGPQEVKSSEIVQKVYLGEER